MPDAPDNSPPQSNGEPQRQENNSNPTTNSNPSPAQAAPLENPPTRECTQTDQLNKRLLTSLLERMNAGDEALQRMMTPDKSDDDTWETDPGDDPTPT